MSSTPGKQDEQRQSIFFRLPMEIRLMVYREYLLIEGGYTFNFDTGKLVTAADGPIDLRLMYTCKKGRGEMIDLPLRTNTITFKTLYSEELHYQADRFRHFQKRSLDNGLEAMLTHILPLIGTSLAKRINDEFGQDIMQRFNHLLDGWGPAQKSPYRDDDLAFSYDARRKTLQLAVTDPVIHHHLSTHYFPRYMTAWLPSRGHHDLPMPLNPLSVDDILAMERGMDSWWIPTHEQLDDLTRNPYYYGAGWSKHRHEDERVNWVAGMGFSNETFIIRRFSAAAAAIHFLKSLPVLTRMDIRNIVVHEDHASIGGPADILGLVPFCNENPRLRIQQRVDIWSAVMSHHRWFQRPSWFWETDRSWDGDKQPWLTFQQNFPRVLSSQLSMFEDNAVPGAIRTVFVAEDLPEWIRAMAQRSVAEITAWVKSVDPSTSDQADYMWFQGHYISRSWLAFVEALVKNDTTGQVRLDFALDPGLAEVWSDAWMISEVSTHMRRRSEEYDFAMEAWWTEGAVQVHLPVLPLPWRNNETFFHGRTRLRPGEQHPPTTRDAIIPAPVGTPYELELGLVITGDEANSLAYLPDLVELLAPPVLPTTVAVPGGVIARPNFRPRLVNLHITHPISPALLIPLPPINWGFEPTPKSLPGPGHGEVEQDGEAELAAEPSQEEDQEDTVPSTSNT